MRIASAPSVDGGTVTRLSRATTLSFGRVVLPWTAPHFRDTPNGGVAPTLRVFSRATDRRTAMTVNRCEVGTSGTPL